MKFDILKIGLDPILHFESIGRLQSLKLAAGELGLSQPAVTHSLNKLESNLGVQLCLRSRTQFALTEAGKNLYHLSKDIKYGLKKYQNFLENNESFDGFFSIGMLDNLQNRQFEKVLRKTISAFPNMKLNIQIYSASDIQRLVAVGELDIGIGIFNEKKAHLTYSIVGTETICHYISEHHPLWNKKEINDDDVKKDFITWVDILTRDKLTLESEIFIQNKKNIKNINSYTNNLHTAAMLLKMGASIVPLPSEFLKSQKVDFKYRKLDGLFKSYILKQELVSRNDVANSSAPTQFFLNQF